MLTLRPPPRRSSAEAALLPMINVVFLLLIFFLISARLTPPEAFAVSPPAAEGQASDPDLTLLMAADGTLGFRTAQGQAQALEALAAARDDWCAARDCTATPPVLTLRADAAAPARALGALMPALARLGFARIDLATAPR